MFYNILLLVHCSACVLMILVALQTGRRAGLAVFGGRFIDPDPVGFGLMKNFTAVWPALSFIALLTLLDS